MWIYFLIGWYWAFLKHQVLWVFRICGSSKRGLYGGEATFKRRVRTKERKLLSDEEGIAMG